MKLRYLLCLMLISICLGQFVATVPATKGGPSWTMVQHPSYHLPSSGTSITINATNGGMASTTAGNLFLFVYLNNNTCNAATSITETGGSDTWTAVGGAWATGKTCGYYVLSGTGGVTGISSGTIASGGAEAFFFEIHRSTGTPALDGTPTSTYNGATTATWSSGSVTTTGTSDILIGMVADVSRSSGAGLASTSGMAIIQTEQDGNVGWTVAGLDQLNVSANSYNNTGTSTNTDGLSAALLAFK